MIIITLVTLVVLHAIKLGLQSKNRQRKLADSVQSVVKSVNCVYNNADSVTHNNTAVCLSLENL